MISLDLPWALLLLPLPWFIWRFVPPHRERDAALRVPFFRQIAASAQAEIQQGAAIRNRSRLQMGAGIIIWCLIVLALAQPARVGAPVERVKAACDVIMAIDISGSMDAKDFKSGNGKPLQRLLAVKNVVRDFVAEREGDRMALIVFGSKAYLQAPLTEDLESITTLLDRTEVGIAGPHTAIGDAIGLAIKNFETSEIKQRLLILLSDGTDTASVMSPANATEIAASKSVEIYTIAVGDPNAEGENKVDVATLQKIATRTGGEFFFAGDSAALTSVYARIDALAPRKTETLSYRPRRSLAHWPLGLAVLIGMGTVCLLWLTSGRKHRKISLESEAEPG